MDRVAKQNTVVSLNEDFSRAHTMIIVHYSGMNVAEITELRRKMRGLNASFRVTKNKLAKLALKDKEYYDEVSALFVGPTAVAFSEDPVAAAKGVVDFAKNNDKLVIIGGIFDGKQIDLEGIKSLAKLPSLDELRAKIISMINTPATRIAGVIQAPGGQIARVVGAYSQQEG